MMRMCVYVRIVTKRGRESEKEIARVRKREGSERRVCVCVYMRVGVYMYVLVCERR